MFSKLTPCGIHRDAQLYSDDSILLFYSSNSIEHQIIGIIIANSAEVTLSIFTLNDNRVDCKNIFLMYKKLICFTGLSKNAILTDYVILNPISCNWKLLAGLRLQTTYSWNRIKRVFQEGLLLGVCKQIYQMLTCTFRLPGHSTEIIYNRLHQSRAGGQVVTKHCNT